MAWTIRFDRSAERDLEGLPRQVVQRIVNYLERQVAPLDNPRSRGQALHGPEFGHLWKYRVGDYRVIASIEDATVTILVVKVGNRRDVYR